MNDKAIHYISYKGAFIVDLLSPEAETKFVLGTEVKSEISVGKMTSNDERKRPVREKKLYICRKKGALGTGLTTMERFKERSLFEVCLRKSVIEFSLGSKFHVHRIYTRKSKLKPKRSFAQLSSKF